MTALCVVLQVLGETISSLELTVVFRDRTDPSTIECAMSLIQMYMEIDRTKDAVLLFKKLITDCAHLLGSEHPLTILISNMGFVAVMEE